MASELKWRDAKLDPPKQGQRLFWLGASTKGGEVAGTKGPGMLWFFTDGTYAYYEPILWRERNGE